MLKCKYKMSSFSFFCFILFVCFLRKKLTLFFIEEINWSSIYAPFVCSILYKMMIHRIYFNKMTAEKWVLNYFYFFLYWPLLFMKLFVSLSLYIYICVYICVCVCVYYYYCFTHLRVFQTSVSGGFSTGIAMNNASAHQVSTTASSYCTLKFGFVGWVLCHIQPISTKRRCRWSPLVHLFSSTPVLVPVFGDCSESTNYNCFHRHFHVPLFCFVFSSLERSTYLSLFPPSFSFSLGSAGTAKSTIW